MNRFLVNSTRLIVSRRLFSTTIKIDGPLGFIGLGHMGAKMVENLSKDGREIIVYDANQSAIDKVLLTAKNTNKSVTTLTLEEMSQKCSIIFSMLPNDKVLFNSHFFIIFTLNDL